MANSDIFLKENSIRVEVDAEDNDGKLEVADTTGGFGEITLDPDSGTIDASNVNLESGADRPPRVMLEGEDADMHLGGWGEDGGITLGRSTDDEDTAPAWRPALRVTAHSGERHVEDRTRTAEIRFTDDEENDQLYLQQDRISFPRGGDIWGVNRLRVFGEDSTIEMGNLESGDDSDGPSPPTSVVEISGNPTQIDSGVVRLNRRSDAYTTAEMRGDGVLKLGYSAGVTTEDQDPADTGTAGQVWFDDGAGQRFGLSAEEGVAKISRIDKTGPYGNTSLFEIDTKNDEIRTKYEINEESL